jgi:hypothetical protein
MESNFDFIFTKMISTTYITSCNYEFIKKIYRHDYHYDFPKDKADFSLIGKFFQIRFNLDWRSKLEEEEEEKKKISKILNF